MSFQAYLDNIEEKTGLTPRQFIELARDKGLDGPEVKAGAIVDWLKADYDLGRGHAMALVHVIKNGPRIDSKHVDSGGTHSDPSDMLWLDGKADQSGFRMRLGTRLLATAALIVVVVGCGGGSATGTPAGSPSTTAPSSSAPTTPLATEVGSIGPFSAAGCPVSGPGILHARSGRGGGDRGGRHGSHRGAQSAGRVPVRGP